MRTDKIASLGSFGYRIGAGISATLFLTSCHSSTPVSSAHESDNVAFDTLAKDVAGIEADVRLKNLEKRMTDLEHKVGEMQGRQEMNDVVAKSARSQPPIGPNPVPDQSEQ